jgi:hypothetical protein
LLFGVSSRCDLDGFQAGSKFHPEFIADHRTETNAMPNITNLSRHPQPFSFVVLLKSGNCIGHAVRLLPVPANDNTQPNGNNPPKPPALAMRLAA